VAVLLDQVSEEVAGEEEGDLKEYTVQVVVEEDGVEPLLPTPMRAIRQRVLLRAEFIESVECGVLFSLPTLPTLTSNERVATPQVSGDFSILLLEFLIYVPSCVHFEREIYSSFTYYLRPHLLLARYND